MAPSDPVETSFLSSGNSKLKKKKSWSSSGLPAAGDANPHSAPKPPPPSEPAPNLLPRGPKINPKPERPGAQADKDFTSGRAGVWLCFESGNLPVALQRGGPTCCSPPEDSFRTSQNTQVRDRAGGCPVAVDNHVLWLKKKKNPRPLCVRPESTWEAPGPQTPDTPCSFLTHLSYWHGVPRDLPLLPGRAF